MRKQRLIDKPTEDLIKLDLEEFISLFLEEKALDFSEPVRLTQTDKEELETLINNICKEAVDKKIVTIKNTVI
jgi:L-lactate utilization protein LutC